MTTDGKPILRHADGSPKCVRSDYSSRKLWHYIVEQDRPGSAGSRRKYQITLCGRWIDGSVVGDTYADEQNTPNAGQPLPICKSCENKQKKHEETERLKDKYLPK